MIHSLKQDGLKKAKMTCTTVLLIPYHVRKLHIGRSPSCPGWGNRAGPERTVSGGWRESPSTGALGLNYASKISRPSALASGYLEDSVMSHSSLDVPFKKSTHTTRRCTYISLLKSVTDCFLEEDDCQHVGRETAKRKFSKIISNYLAYTNISKVVLDHYRRDWEPPNSWLNHSHTHTTNGSKQE